MLSTLGVDDGKPRCATDRVGRSRHLAGTLNDDPAPEAGDQAAALGNHPDATCREGKG